MAVVDPSFLLLDNLDASPSPTHGALLFKLLFGRRLGGRQQRAAAYLEKPAVTCSRSRRGWSRGMGRRRAESWSKQEVKLWLPWVETD